MHRVWILGFAFATLVATLAGPTTAVAQQSDTTESGRPKGVSIVYDRARAEYVAFGGLTRVERTNLESGELPFVAQRGTWKSPDGLTWTLLADASSPPTGGPFEYHLPEFLYYDEQRARVTLLFRSEAGEWQTWTWDGVTWTQRDAIRPADEPRLTLYSAVYDSGRDEIVLFGGLGLRMGPDPVPGGSTVARLSPSLDGTVHNDTWVWNGSGWTRRETAVRPSPRYLPTMACDPKRQAVLLFDAASESTYEEGFNDTWIWDGTTWAEFTSATRPEARGAAHLVYDPARDEMMLFGGKLIPLVPGGEMGGTWTWDGATWTRRGGGLEPPPEADLLYDHLNARTLAVAGKRVWIWDGTRWSVQGIEGPLPRYRPVMAYDTTRGNLLLFGGYSDDGRYLADTWTWDLGVWSHRYLEANPTARDCASVAFDPTQVQVVFFGGNITKNETWTWDGQTWTERRPPSSPVARDCASMAYDAARNEVVLFGGYNRERGLNDTWVWDGAMWRQLDSTTRPPARSRATMVYDTARRQLVLFGGYGCTEPTSGTTSCQRNGPLDDTWLWNGRNWTEAPRGAATPPARYHAAMAYDVARGEVVLFGGEAGTDPGDALGDTWTWDGRTWSQRTGSVGPTALTGAVAVYDPAADRVLLFGGRTCLRAEPYVSSLGPPNQLLCKETGYSADLWAWDGVAWTNLSHP